MLATSNFGSTPSQPHKFLPSVPSPLSPRRANVKNSTSFWSFDTSMATSTSQQASNQPSHVPFSSRPVKAAPIPRSDALRERRRDMFLRKVRQARDENKWDSRIDDMARLDYLKEKRRWEAEQGRSAPSLHPEFAEAEEVSDYDLPTYSSQVAWDPQSQPDYPLDPEVDAVLQQENEELEALIALMQEEDHRRNKQSDSQEAHDDRSSAFGSDDDEYDNIFMNMIDETGGAASASEQQHQHTADEMDLS
ncbi:unnamed protein product [Aureobasidium uvarum]|uniref:Uncharacterized protein n=1 Tax=Aureobasidium uvarum TaxID=2773716 RepID=A0A9N8KMB7_9PEZI|nr:unnamed protein product [Aureobasidium uvarum]